MGTVYIGTGWTITVGGRVVATGRDARVVVPALTEEEEAKALRDDDERFHETNGDADAVSQPGGASTSVPSRPLLQRADR